MTFKQFLLEARGIWNQGRLRNELDKHIRQAKSTMRGGRASIIWIDNMVIKYDPYITKPDIRDVLSEIMNRLRKANIKLKNNLRPIDLDILSHENMTDDERHKIFFGIEVRIDSREWYDELVFYKDKLRNVGITIQ